MLFRSGDIKSPPLLVTEGETYPIRVSGFGGVVGDYTLEVECTNACCFPTSGRCGFLPVDDCIDLGGMPRGTHCMRDGFWDSVCCPEATMVDASPPDNTIDARQPHEPDAKLPRQGVGSPGETGSNREPIVITLDPPATGAAGCFNLCESREDALLGSNTVGETVDLGDGRYEITLDHAIPAGTVTTLQYVVDDSFVTYTAHPGNVDGGAMMDAADLQHFFDDCYNNPVPAIHRCDLDHSQTISPADALRAIDLYNGSDELESWMNTPLPTASPCP